MSWRLVVKDTFDVTDRGRVLIGILENCGLEPQLGEPVRCELPGGTTVYASLRGVERHAMPNWWKARQPIGVLLSGDGQSCGIGAILTGSPFDDA